MKLSGGCLGGVWQVSFGCLDGVLRVSGRCLEIVWRVSGRCLSKVRTGQVRTGSDRCLEGEGKSGLAKLGQVKSQLVK